MLLRDQILNRKAGRFETVAVPEWGGDVMIKAQCVRDRSVIETEFARLGPNSCFATRSDRYFPSHPLAT